MISKGTKATVTPKETNQANPTSTLHKKETPYSSTTIAKATTTTKVTKATVTCIEKTGTSNYGYSNKEINNYYSNSKRNNNNKTNIEIVKSKETEQENPTSATTKDTGKINSCNAREINFMAASSVIDCNICQKKICLNGQTATIFLKKMTACCGTSTSVYVGCDIKFSKCVDSCYEFDAKTYVKNSGIKLYCAQCKQKILLLWEKSRYE